MGSDEKNRVKEGERGDEIRGRLSVESDNNLSDKDNNSQIHR